MIRQLLVLSSSGLVALALAVPPAVSATTPLCFGKSATVIGTAGDDYLFFGPNDVVVGGGGNDYINGEDEGTYTAYICGGPGADGIRGGRGVDHVNGNGGDDSIMGGYGGDDTLLGGSGNDRLEDFDDFDYPDSSDPGTDVLRGGPGSDLVYSECGVNRVHGGAGHDTLIDYTRAKTYLYGGAGDDTFDATRNEAGSNVFVPDRVSGDTGHDVALVHSDDIVTSSTEDLSFP